MRLDRAKLREAVEYTTGYTTDIQTVDMWSFSERTEGMGWNQSRVRIAPDMTPAEAPAFIDRQMYEGTIMTYEEIASYRSQPSTQWWSAFVLNSLWQRPDGTFVAEGQVGDNLEIMVWGPSREKTTTYLETGPEAEPEPDLGEVEELPSEADFTEGDSVLTRVSGLDQLGFKLVHGQRRVTEELVRCQRFYEALEALQTVSEYDSSMDAWQDRQVQIPQSPYRLETIEIVYKQVARIAVGHESNFEHFYSYKEPAEIRDVWENGGTTVASVRGFLGNTILVWGPGREATVEFLQNGPAPTASGQELSDQEELPSEASFEKSHFHGPYENIELLGQLGFSR